MPRVLSKLGRISGLISEALGTKTMKVNGHVGVEMIDPRTNRIVSQQKSKNYINTTMVNEWAKAVQKLVWSYGYQGDASTVTNSPYTARDPRYMPTVRNDHIACWTDTTAETTADMFAFGEVVAWAHRWQQGSPSTRQGIVVPSLCTIGPTSVKWVWEWGTTNGNGTFQSIGWRRISLASNAGDTRLADLLHFSRQLNGVASYTGDPSTSVSSVISFSPGQQFNGGAFYYDSGSGKLYFITYASATWKLCSSPVTIDGNGNISLGAVTDESSAAIAAGVSGDNLSTATRSTFGLTRLGTGDWIAVGCSGSGTARRPVIRRVTAAGAVIYTNANAGTYAVESTFIDVTYDGTNIWVTATNASTGAGAVHRIDPATGTISATITAVAGVPAYFPQWTTGNSPIAIEWDPTSGCLWVQWTHSTGTYWCGIDSSGNWNGVLLTITTSDYPPSPGSLSGQHVGRAPTLGLFQTDDFAGLWGGNLTSGDPSASDSSWPYGQGPPQNWTSGFIPSGLSITQTGKGRLITIDGDVWLQGGSFASYIAGTPTGVDKHGWLAFTDRPNFATRTLLGSPATKPNTQSMRVSYTMTFS